MSAAYLLFSLLAAVAFYLASGHQCLWPRARKHARVLRAVACACIALALGAAIVESGVWAGVFSVLTALMLAWVLLPYVDAWRQLRRGAANVG